MTTRRDLLLALGVSAVVVSGTLAAQLAGKVFRIGILSSGTPSPISQFVVRTLQEMGYVEGKNAQYELRFAEGQVERLPDLAANLVSLKVDVIFAFASAAAAAAKDATTTIPIVFASTHGAVESGLVASYRRPGGNLTGTESLAPELDAKRLEYLREVLPKARRIAVINNPLDPGTSLHMKWSGTAAAKLGFKLETFSVRRRNELDPVLETISRLHPDAVLLMTDGIILSLRSPIMEFALPHKIAVFSEFSQVTELGGLLSYGPILEALYRSATRLVDKVLKGARPADLPVEMPTEIELAVNLKTAKALGINIPQGILVRANKVIE